MFQFSQGQHTTQGHKGIPDGCFEEEHGRKGFFGPVTHLIKPEAPTRWTAIEGNLKPHLYDVVKMEKKYGQWTRLFFNSDCTIYNYWDKPQSGSEKLAFRNADGDTIYFCHIGGGTVLTEYGALPFKRGHYINIPKCVHHTFLFEAETQMLVIESKSGPYREPDRGMVGRNAFYDQAAFGKPSLDLLKEVKKSHSADVREIWVKRLEETTKFYYSADVYDTLGWKGDFFPVTLHVDDLMPMMSARVHLPPSAHTTFAANGFVVCTFCPRPIETDKDALKVPFYHQNIDFDEVLFYHDGNFFSRDNLHSGMITLHPAGFPHGPHPKAFKNAGSKSHTDEYAVMIDSWKPLTIDKQMNSIEVNDYWKSWMTK